MNALKRRYYNWRADVHLLSYPKCGRTWLRLMLTSIMESHFGIKADNPLQLHKLGSRSRGIPCILASHDWRDRPADAKGVRLETEKSRFAGKRIVLLVRDPRDVVVSNYYQKKYREKLFSGTLHEFVHHPLWGIDNIVRYYNVWADQQSIASAFLIVRYEDLRADTANELERILRFVGIYNVDPDVIERAVREFAFENMKMRESSGHYGNETLRAVERADTRTYKTRSGRIGGYVQELDPEDREYVDRVVASDKSGLLDSRDSSSPA